MSTGPGITPSDGPSGHHVDDAPATARRTGLDLLKEALWAMPATLTLLGRLMMDPQVPRRHKVVAALAIGYLASPIDLVPDVIPLLGRVDDVVLAAFAVDRLLRSVPPEVRERYWTGSPETLELVTGLLSWGSEMVPARVRRLLGP